MNRNPYQAPQPPQAPGPPGYPPGAAAVNRTPFVLAAVGAGLASVYWAALTLLIGLGVALGSGSVTQVIVPGILIVLYAMRGWQIFKGDPNAARRILWLHGVGGVVAIMQMMQGSGLLVALQGVKVVIHVFGGVTAYLAQRAYADAVRAPFTPPAR
jgi:hypothetical protein